MFSRVSSIHAISVSAGLLDIFIIEITRKGTLDSQSQVIKFTSYFPMVGGSLQVLRLTTSDTSKRGYGEVMGIIILICPDNSDIRSIRT
jgi:hypothetical protein